MQINLRTSITFQYHKKKLKPLLSKPIVYLLYFDLQSVFSIFIRKYYEEKHKYFKTIKNLIKY